MKKYALALLFILALCLVGGCAASNTPTPKQDAASQKASTQTAAQTSAQNAAKTATQNKDSASTGSQQTQGEIDMHNCKITITVADKQLTATLEDNAATRAFVKKLPLTLPMQNLYSREMCYRYGAGGLPTDKLRSDHYTVGDIAYWPPRGSLVILYAQNNEEFERQNLGHIEGDVSFFAEAGDKQVTFALAK